MSRQRTRLAAVLVPVLTALVLIAGCHPIGDERKVRWRPPDPEHTVSRADALRRAKPVIVAVAEAVGQLDSSAEWGDLTAEARVFDKRCALVISVYGAVEINPEDGDFDDLGDAVEAAAGPFGYTDLVRQGRGGPGVEFADIAEDHSMLVAGHDGTTETSIEIYVAAHHDQCDWTNYSWG